MCVCVREREKGSRRCVGNCWIGRNSPSRRATGNFIESKKFYSSYNHSKKVFIIMIIIILDQSNINSQIDNNVID